jgi:hypothetical protein
MDESLEGWYTDPYGRHQARWMSEGVPSALVRDGKVEGQDPVEQEPFQVSPVRSGSGATATSNASDLRRADDPDRNSEFDSRDPVSGAWSGSGLVPVANSEPVEHRAQRSRLGFSLDVTFDVGDRERHSVRFTYNLIVGVGRIRVDGVLTQRIFPVISLSRSRRFPFSVGDHEFHDVEIEKVRNWLWVALGLGGRQFLRVFVDGEFQNVEPYINMS